MNLIKRAPIITFLIALSVFLFIWDYPACAFKMNIDPPRNEIFANPGEEKGGYITVFNQGEDKSIHVKAYINDLVYLPDGSNDFLPEGTTPWSAADWLKIGPTEFDVPPQDEVKVRYIVNIPEGVKGAKYGVVFFEALPAFEELKDRTGAAINIRLGSMFLITAKGTEKYDAELEDIKVGKPDKDGVFEIYCTVKNNGNVLIRPNGPIKIMDASETEIAELELNAQKSGVFPETSRRFSVKYDRDKLVPGEYFVQAVLDYGGETYLGGQIGFTVK